VREVEESKSADGLGLDETRACPSPSSQQPVTEAVSAMSCGSSRHASPLVAPGMSSPGTAFEGCAIGRCPLQGELLKESTMRGY
jgi:hypothetical protein